MLNDFNYIKAISQENKPSDRDDLNILRESVRIFIKLILYGMNGFLFRWLCDRWGVDDAIIRLFSHGSSSGPGGSGLGMLFELAIGLLIALAFYLLMQAVFFLAGCLLMNRCIWLIRRLFMLEPAALSDAPRQRLTFDLKKLSVIDMYWVLGTALTAIIFTVLIFYTGTTPT